MQGTRQGKTGRSILGGLLLLLTAIFCIGASSRAEQTEVHRAARISFLQGSVTVHPPDNTAEYPGTINMPLATGVHVSTGHDGQAEIQFEDGSVLRLAPNSSLALTSLDADSSGNYHTSATGLHGLIYAELRATAKFTYSLNADDDVISPVANATLRIDMDKPPAVVAVFDGTVQVTHAATEEDKAKVAAGLTITADPSDNTRFFIFKGIKRNSWDDWNQSRDQDAAATLSARTSARDDYAGQQGYGWSDLDQNGTWYDVPGQGQVWQPDEAQDLGFDPYGYGSWIPYPGVGYVWASGYGWGWTPFRCGSWSYWNTFGWGWSPLSSCGLGGWGFGGVVYIVNIVRPPLHYHLPTRPVHPGNPHPVPVGHPLHLSPETPRPVPGPRMIAGVLAHPLTPVHSAALFGGPVTGAALLSNFPIDRMTHQPVTGIAGTSMPGGVYRFTLPPPAAMNGGTSYHPPPPMRPASPAPPPHYSAPTYTPQYSAPAPHSAPPPAAPHR